MVAAATAAAVFGRLGGAPLPVAARELARAGVPVFPCAPGGKRPIPERGFHEASVDLDRVEGWWRARPTANIGIPTGAVSGLVVIDVDVHRVNGYVAQYFAAVEPQKRLAPHLHAAIRGTIPRAIVKQVAAATYFAAWWPSCTDADVVYGDHDEPPVWDEETANYLDPTTGEVLPSWKEATSRLEDPAHVVRLGKQVDVKGLLGGTPDSDRAVRYLCKYLTKSIAGTYAAGDDDGVPQAHQVAYERHVDRLHAHVKVLPCGPDCANWLRYGVQPKNPTPGMKPGGCLSPAHDRENLGLGGRRVLVSRGWSGKTLTEHRADRAAVVRQALEAAGIEHDDADRLSTTQETSDGHARYVWREPEAGSFTYAAVIAASLQETLRRRSQYDAAKHVLGLAPPGSPGPVDNRSATATLAA